MNATPETDALEIFRSAIGAIVDGDLDRALSLMREDVVLDWSRSRGPLQGVHRRQQGARRFWEDLLDAWDPVGWDVKLVARPDPDTVVVESRPQYRGRGSGIELGARAGLIVRGSDGKLISVTLFQSPEEALAASEDEAGGA